MYLELDEQLPGNRYTEYVKGDTIVIDNGTYECKAGYAGGEPQMVFKNLLYRNKGCSSIENFQGSSVRTMFDGDVVTNFGVLEGIMDEILRYTEPRKLVNLIFTEKAYSPTHVGLIEFLFRVYRFERVQIGVDSCYSYMHNIPGENCMIVDMSHSAVTCFVVEDGAVSDTYKINFGGCAAGDYMVALMSSKFFDEKRNYRGLIRHLRCSMDYDNESVEMLEMMKNGDYSKSWFLDKEHGEPSPDVVEKKREKYTPSTRSALPEINVGLMKTADVDLDTEDIKEKKRQKILYHSTIYRLKMRIEKCFKRLMEAKLAISERYEKLKDMDGFIERKKEEFWKLRRELDARERLRRDTKNRKCCEFQVRLKTEGLTSDDKILLERVRDAEDFEKEDQLLDKLRMLVSDIREVDSSFEPYTANTVDIISGRSVRRICVNVDLLKVPEIIFSPSIIGLDQMGLSEIMEEVCRKYNVKQVFLTGGFSQIEGIDERIEKEMTSMSFIGQIRVVRAKDAVNDAFKGARFSDMFPTYTLEEFERLGAEKLVDMHKEKFRGTREKST